ncbi:unnamed protein product, partial [Larinioides sclopetarius]
FPILVHWVKLFLSLSFCSFYFLIYVIIQHYKCFVILELIFHELIPTTFMKRSLIKMMRI